MFSSSVKRQQIANDPPYRIIRINMRKAFLYNKVFYKYKGVYTCLSHLTFFITWQLSFKRPTLSFLSDVWALDY